MTRAGIVMASIAVLGLFAGCGGGGHHDDGDVEGSVEESRWREIEGGSSSSYKPKYTSYLVVRDPVAWTFLYKWTKGAEADVPEVDFDVDLVASVFLGNRPSGGYSVAFESVTWSGDGATYHVVETSPAPTDIVLAVITSPYAFARMTAPTGDVYAMKDWKKMLIYTQERDLGMLATEDWQNRQVIPLTQSAHFEDLGNGVCPVDGTSLESAQMDLANASFASHALYCVTHGHYWVKQVPGLSVDPYPFLGPVTPGSYSTILP